MEITLAGLPVGFVKECWKPRQSNVFTFGAALGALGGWLQALDLLGAWEISVSEEKEDVHMCALRRFQEPSKAS